MHAEVGELFYLDMEQTDWDKMNASLESGEQTWANVRVTVEGMTIQTEVCEVLEPFRVKLKVISVERTQ